MDGRPWRHVRTVALRPSHPFKILFGDNSPDGRAHANPYQHSKRPGLHSPIKQRPEEDSGLLNISAWQCCIHGTLVKNGVLVSVGDGL